MAAGHIIYSVAKITRAKQGGLPPVTERMKRVYQHLTVGQPLVFHGGCRRLPESVAAALVLRPFVARLAAHPLAGYNEAVYTLQRNRSKSAAS